MSHDQLMLSRVVVTEQRTSGNARFTNILLNWAEYEEKGTGQPRPARVEDGVKGSRPVKYPVSTSHNWLALLSRYLEPFTGTHT